MYKKDRIQQYQIDNFHKIMMEVWGKVREKHIEQCEDELKVIEKL